MIHLIKLAVGIRDIDHLREVQSLRAAARPPLRSQTRNAPRRVDEVLDGGSIYWVINRAITVRQRILDIVPDQWDACTACCGLVLDPTLVQVAARKIKPFQGWRYLEPGDAPPDIGRREKAKGQDEIPEEMLRELRELCLI